METRNFPDGYEVKVYRKKDILDTIEQNIIDKDIALEIIKKCEVSCNNHMKEGVWAGIPFMGNFKLKEHFVTNNTPERQEMFAEAREVLSKEQYIIFRHRVNYDNMKHAKYVRYYKYITAMAINKNKKLHKKLRLSKGEAYANLYMFALASITAANNEYEILL